ncbi:MarR family winged helix-turn-helix transcriptional regulator [Microbacterium sp. JZ31]|uniref:MarR family winged helix-turn-helix transcriptional regulator n=1 Tax=Microbacterium sp. JZ31 TaxID=1906274 RepID=UPI0019332D7E|nr:MarR family transcriptional regulator [Microbacterium sp. JZ31]
MFDPRVLDPGQEIVSLAGIPPHEIDQIVELLRAMRAWREADERMSEASRRYMKLGDTDMRALRFIIAGQQNGMRVTPGAIAAHLGISTASTTKLLDRLAAAGHVRRLPHPSDRRSVIVEVEDQTRRAARDSIGRTHGRRFDLAAQLTPEQRDVIIRFLHDIAATADDLAT